jgi:integrase
MSVYKSPKSPYYRYDFVIEGHRFHGSTRCKARREAEAIECAQRERARERVKEQRRAQSSMQLDDVAGRYWLEVGQYHSGSSDTERDLARLVDRLGKTKLLTEITDADVTALVAWRRSHRVIRSPKASKADAPLISNATVNRSTTGVLKKLFTYADVARSNQPNWKKHMLPEPPERIRELRDEEAERLHGVTRADYEPFFAFAHATGLRLRECVTLRWSEVNWETRQIIKIGKGGKHVMTPITSPVREIIWPLQGHHSEFVFTFVAERRRSGGRIKGQRYPLSVAGIKTLWRRLCTAAGVKGLRFHDLRHDFASKLLRETGNLKLVQRALNHADLKTTSRYAHVLDDEVADALERHQKSRGDISKAG